MARYIDADKLIAEYDRVHIGAPGGARKLMVDAPTCNVVPKSEVDKTIAEWAYLHADTLNKLENSKAEVAREIFEEIQKMVNRYWLDNDYGMPDMETELTKLKKKYTEDHHA